MWVCCFCLLLSCASRQSRTTSNEWDDNPDNAQVEQTANSTNDDTTPPSWVEGDWSLTVPGHGVMGIRIQFQGNRIWETDFDGTMQSGTYHYDAEQHTIYSEETFYELDLANHRISAGSGYYFHKGSINSSSEESNTVPCSYCGGTGKIAQRGGGMVLGYTNCPYCGGTGKNYYPN